LHNRKTDNDRQVINKQHAAAEINRLTNQHKKEKKEKTAQIVVVCVPILLIDRGWSDHVNNIKYKTNCSI